MSALGRGSGIAALVVGWVFVSSFTGIAAASTTTTVDAGRGPVTVYVPSGYTPGTPIPLLLLLHGYGGSGAGVESYFGYLPLVDIRGFAYAFPSGRVNSAGQRFWTATDACCNFFNQGGPDDDSTYLRALVDLIRGTLDIDAERIWLAGHSNGGFMSYRMACDHSEIIAGIVSLAGATFADPAACAARQPVHVLQVHGTADNVILYGGGSLGGHPYPGAIATSRAWARNDGCNDSLVATTVGALDLVAGAALETDILRYAAGCNIPGSAEHWRMNGASHSPAFSASFNDRTIDFLFAHPKQKIRFQNSTTLSWPAVDAATSYEIYLGYLPLADGTGDGLPDDGYGSCINHTDPDVSDTTFVDELAPDPGEGFIYTVGYVDEDFGQHGGIGVTSSGEQRTAPPPCP
jgi:polyhydroxybutyrate depolymerase